MSYITITVVCWVNLSGISSAKIWGKSRSPSNSFTALPEEGLGMARSKSCLTQRKLHILRGSLPSPAGRCSQLGRAIRVT